VGDDEVAMHSLPFMFNIFTLWRDLSVFAKQYQLAIPIELNVFL
jgi:hypothetical protein